MHQGVGDLPVPAHDLHQAGFFQITYPGLVQGYRSAVVCLEEHVFAGKQIAGNGYHLVYLLTTIDQGLVYLQLAGDQNVKVVARIAFRVEGVAPGKSGKLHGLQLELGRQGQAGEIPGIVQDTGQAAQVLRPVLAGSGNAVGADCCYGMA